MGHQWQSGTWPHEAHQSRSAMGHQWQSGTWPHEAHQSHLQSKGVSVAISAAAGATEGVRVKSSKRGVAPPVGPPQANQGQSSKSRQQSAMRSNQINQGKRRTSCRIASSRAHSARSCDAAAAAAASASHIWRAARASCRRQSEAIRGNQRQSVATRGHQILPHLEGCS
eukprot:7381438-Prymnesium_polylepis.1